MPDGEQGSLPKPQRFTEPPVCLVAERRATGASPASIRIAAQPTPRLLSIKKFIFFPPKPKSLRVVCYSALGNYYTC